MRATILLLTLFLGALLFSSVQGQVLPAKKEPLVDQVKKAIQNGIGYLRQQQRPDGGWEVSSDQIGYTGGWSCLALLALLEAGVPLDDPMMKSGLEYVRRINNPMVYVISLQTMALSKARQPADLEKINQNVKLLLKARIVSNGEFLGWSYTAGSLNADGSNTQFAMLGLLAGREAGIKVPEEVWKSIRHYYSDSQRPDGTWKYSRQKVPGHDADPMTMTTAGLSGLLISGMELKEGREELVKNGPAINCGSYKDNVPVAKALHWLSHNYRYKELLGTGRTFYNLYGIERAGRLSGKRFFGAHDWYREGCEFLVKDQRDDGSWSVNFHRDYDRWPIVNTCFALLFLSKGRTPVLISRIVHGAWPRLEIDHDWDADRYAIKHLTEFAAENLFRNVPLAWQSFDIQQALESKQRAPTDEDLLDVTSELLQSPIIFINGHNSPLRRFTANEKEILKRFVENGGFIFAEACCGSPNFDQGFKDLVKELWPDNDLKDLSADHPIWSAHFPVPPGSFRLMGLESGCKTVLVYSPEDMSCRWEANITDDKDFKGMLAFRTGANVIAYATGMEAPRPRLTEMPVDNAKDAEPKPPRGYLKVAQLKYHSSNWQPARRAMPSLMSYLRKFAGMDVAIEPAIIDIQSERLTDYKFLYLHGKGDPKLNEYSDEALKQLKFNLDTGALLFADACCGNAVFDKAFDLFVARLFPKHKLEPVPPSDPLFGKELNGDALTAKNIRCRTDRDGVMHPIEPFLEGIKINDRWVLLYSKYDIGCALERHQSPDCLGYDYESARRIAGAAVLYLMRP